MRNVNLVLVAVVAVGGCGGPVVDGTDGTAELGSVSQEISPANRGRDVWFENTYGGEKFFTFLANHPDPAKRIRIAFDEVVKTPRNQRFDVWGVINDPDCVADPNGGPDVCPDSHATGVVGIRRFPGPSGTTMYGVACASCHAGFDPIHPPADPNEPEWENIHATIGNQYAKFGKIFSNNLAPADPRRFMFAGWPDGSVDTTALFNDNIMNPGVVTAFWEHKHRPTFDVGSTEPKMRNGQGGEDDLGGDVAAIRVYTNIGVCFAECVAPRPDRPDPSAPIDLEQCRAACSDFPPQSDLDDMTAFLRTFSAPKFPGGPGNDASYRRGREMFDQNCAQCHDRSGESNHVLSNDEVNPIAADSANATNTCRTRSTLWQEGKIWAAFSSDVYKDRADAGDRGYRTMPLAGIWATEPFLHNQSIGPWAAPTATPEQRKASYVAAMRELLSAERAPKVNTLPIALGPFPAGTPLTFVFSRDPATSQLLCDDAIENRGHHYGSALSDSDKDALIEWLLHE